VNERRPSRHRHHGRDHHHHDRRTALLRACRIARVTMSAVLLMGAVLFVLNRTVGENASLVILNFAPLILLVLFRITKGRRALERDPFTDRIIRIAVVLAGSRRSGIGLEWRAHLAGAPDEGIVMSPWLRFRFSLGFVLAAVRFRLHDVAVLLWRPVDWVLVTDGRRNAVIATVVGVLAVVIVGDRGLGALAVDVWQPCTILGGGLYALSHYLRRRRGIEATGASGADRSD
jgi:hypothetical protein